MHINNTLSNLLSRKLLYFDVGARAGLDEPWRSFKTLLELISFEPDQEEYRALLKNKKSHETFFPCALHKESKKSSLYLTKSRGCSSLLRPNEEFLKNYPNADRFVVESVVEIDSDSLDNLYLNKTISNLDFIKIDVQGAELDVLIGGKKFLSENVLGIEVEVEFQSMYQEQPLFAEVDDYIRNSIGLQVYDIRKAYWKYNNGKNVGGLKGQLIFGDALYLRAPNELISWCSHFSQAEAQNKLKMAILVGIIYGYLNYSFCILSQKSINKFFDQSIIDTWKSIVVSYGKSIKYRSIFADKFATLFDLLCNIFRPGYEGWASSERHLGMRKKFGVWY